MAVSSKKVPRGFSLVELGIVLAVIAILAVVVISSAGYFRAARERTAVELVLTIRKASQQFSLRHRKGLSYGISVSQNDPANVTLKGLRAEGFLPTNVTTPWADPNIIVTPHTAGTTCAEFACIKIDMPVPAEECAGSPPYLVASLQDKAVSATCNGTTFSVVMR